MTIAPYGGQLVDRIPPADRVPALLAHAKTLPRIAISDVTRCDLYLIAVGAYSPLRGFLGHAEYESVLERMQLADGLPWSLPITLSATREEAARFGPGDDVALMTAGGIIAAILHVDDVHSWDRDREAGLVYRTHDRAHPGVARLDAMGDRLVGGEITYLDPQDVSGFATYNVTPAATRAEFGRRGWKTVVAFQTRNPVHRAHEYLQKCALEMVDGLLLHPLVGDTKSDDVPADVRMRCYAVLLEKYYPPGRVLLSVLPAAMRYAGPREAIFHAIVRRNYGCTHFIVGRDHAGVGSYYGTYDAQRIFDEIDTGRLGIQPLMFEHAFWCRTCAQMSTTRTCPHGSDHHVFLSGTRVRAMLTAGERPPAEFTRPEVADVLVQAYAHPVAEGASR